MIYLFPNFLNNHLEYHICRDYWNAKVTYLFQQYDIKDFKPYLRTTWGNGQEMYNANPLTSFYVREKNRAIRIIQEEAESDKIEFSAWINKTEIDNKATKELVIVLELSPETEIIALNFIKKWIVDLYSEEQIEQIIDDL